MKQEYQVPTEVPLNGQPRRNGGNIRTRITLGKKDLFMKSKEFSGLGVVGETVSGVE